MKVVLLPRTEAYNKLHPKILFFWDKRKINYSSAIGTGGDAYIFCRLPNHKLVGIFDEQKLEWLFIHNNKEFSEKDYIKVASLQAFD